MYYYAGQFDGVMAHGFHHSSQQTTVPGHICHVLNKEWKNKMYKFM